MKYLFGNACDGECAPNVVSTSTTIIDRTIWVNCVGVDAQMFLTFDVKLMNFVSISHALMATRASTNQRFIANRLTLNHSVFFPTSSWSNFARNMPDLWQLIVTTCSGKYAAWKTERDSIMTTI